MNILSPITDEHYNRTSHGSHPLLQMKQGYNSAMQLFSVTKGWKAKWRVKKYRRAKKSSNYHDYEKRERQKYQRAWPKSLKVISTPRPEKCPLRLFNDCAGCGMSMRACNWNVTDSMKKTIFDLIIRGQVFDMIVQFCTGSICGWNLFQLLGLGVPVHLQKSKLAWYNKSLNC